MATGERASSKVPIALYILVDLPSLDSRSRNPSSGMGRALSYHQAGSPGNARHYHNARHQRSSQRTKIIKPVYVVSKIHRPDVGFCFHQCFALIPFDTFAQDSGMPLSLSLASGRRRGRQGTAISYFANGILFSQFLSYQCIRRYNYGGSRYHYCFNDSTRRRSIFDEATPCVPSRTQSTIRPDSRRPNDGSPSEMRAH
nr:hypothetical protein CFP56_07477 [Quercus suber]